jgi:transcriptional regulator with XRE-family HTH domain
MRSITDRLKWARETAGLSQRRLAKVADLSEAVVRHLEGGTTETIETKTALKLSGALGCSVGWLLAGEGDAPTEESLIALRQEPGAAE